MAVALPTLAAILAAHDDIATVPAPGFRAYVAEAKPRLGPDGSELLVPVVVTAILERTAIVHLPGRDDERRVFRLDAVLVDPGAVRWQPRSRHELKELQSRQRVRANLKRGQAQAAGAVGAGGDGLEAGERARRSSSTSGGGAVLGTAARPA